MSTDRHLLFGLLALQNELIDKTKLVAAFQAWITDRSNSLDEFLVLNQIISESDRAILSQLVDRHISSRGGDVTESLRSLSSVGTIRQELEQLDDGDLTASMEYLRPNDQTSASQYVGRMNALDQRFEYRRPLASGGLGVVSVALDKELNREIALKEIRSDRADEKVYRTKFILEAEVTGSLEHPGIVPVYGLGTRPDGRPYYAMRLIKGDNLQEHIKRFHEDVSNGKEPFDGTALRKLLRRLLDVCQAIDYAHSRGVLHRDLKPGNIMLGKYGETLVVDWGLAKPLGVQRSEQSVFSFQADIEPSIVPSGSNEGMTIQGSMVGTAAYAPPEQLLGDLSLVNERSDVYGLGAILYELLTGRPPARGQNLEAVIKFVTSGSVQNPRSLISHIPKALEAICLRAIAVRPNDRYETAAAMGQEIERWLDDLPVDAYNEPITLRGKRWIRSHQALVATVSAILLMGTVSLAFLSVIVNKNNQALSKANSRETEARKNAEQSALIAEARYFLAKDDLPSTLTKLSKLETVNFNKTSLHSSQDIAIRLMTNEVLEKSRQSVAFVRVIPKDVGNVIFHGDDTLVHWNKNTNIVASHAIYSERSLSRPLDFNPISVLSSSNRIIARGERKIVTLDSNLETVNELSLDRSFDLVSVSSNVLAVVEDNEFLRIHRLSDLSLIAEFRLQELPGFSTGKSHKRIFVSANGKYVIAHALPWTRPATVINTDSRKAIKLAGGEIRLDRDGIIVFDKDQDERFYGLFSPESNGSYENQVTAYKLNEALALEKLSVWYVEGSKPKGVRDLRLQEESFTIFGTDGWLRHGYANNTTNASQSYDAIWPISKVRYASSSNSGRSLALTNQTEVLIFRILENATFQIASENNNSAAASHGVLETVKGSISYRPVIPGRSGFQRSVAWPKDLPDSIWIPWGLDISFTENFVAILAQETETGSDNVSSVYKQKQVILYDVSKGLDSAESWKPVASVLLDNLRGTSGLDNYCIRLSHNGENIYVRCENKATIFRVADGAIEKEFRQNYDGVSPDGKYILATDGNSSQIVDFCSLKNVTSLDIKATGGCFTFDNSTLYVSNGNLIQEFDLNRKQIVGNWESHFVPKASLKTSRHLLAYDDQDRRLTGGRLCILDAMEMSVIATLSESNAIRNNVSILGDDSEIYHRNGRFSYSLVKLMNYQKLLTEITSTRSLEESFESLTSATTDLPIPRAVVNQTDVLEWKQFPSSLDSDLPVCSVEDEALESHLSESIQLEGTVSEVIFSRTRKSVTLLLKSKRQKRTLVSIDSTLYKQFKNEGYSFEKGLAGSVIRVAGKLRKYEGDKQDWRNSMEIKLESMGDLCLLKSKVTD